MVYDGGTSMAEGNTVEVEITKEMVGLSMGWWMQPDGYNSPDATPWYTVDALNSGDPDEQAVVLASELKGGPVYLGFEDQPRDCEYCSHDFNDLVIAVTADAEGVLSDCLTEDVPVLTKDSDGDGVVDGYDDYPDDPDLSLIHI